MAEIEKLSPDEYTQKLHLAVGSFVVTFEHLAIRLRLYLLLMFPDRDNHGYLARLFVHDLSFEQMTQKIKQITKYHTDEKPTHKDLKIVRSLISDACNQINLKRNHIVHGAWVVNYESFFGRPTPDTPSSAVMRRAPDLRGDFSFLVYTVDDINTLTELTKRTTTYFNKVFLPEEKRKEFTVDIDDIRQIISDIQRITGRENLDQTTMS